MPSPLVRVWSAAWPFVVAVLTAVGAGVVVLGVRVLVAGRIGDEEPWLISAAPGQGLVVVALLIVGVLAYRAWTHRGAVGKAANVVMALLLGLASGVGAAALTAILIVVVTGLGKRSATAEPESYVNATLGLYAFLAAALAAVAAMITLWWKRIEQRDFPFLVLVPVAALVVTLIARSALADPPVAESPAAVADRERVERNIAPHHEVIILVDPGAAAGRRLAALAHDDPRAISAPRPQVLDWSLATGLAVPARGAAPWRLLQRPKASRAALIRSLKAMPEASAAAAPDDYAQALRELARGPGGHWSEGTTRSVALVFDELRPAGWGAAIAAVTPHSPPRDGAQRAGVTAIDVVAERGSDAQRERWGAWAAATGGSLTLPDRFDGERHAIDAAEDAATGRPDAETEALAEDFRPYLRFDERELYRPLDVDAYLADTGEDVDANHELCRRTALAQDECVPVRDAADLRPSYGRLRTPAGLTSDAEIVSDLGREIPPRERIYYHRTDRGENVYLDYWWYFRFNASPVANDQMCLRGLAIREATCFDHEGDWEGVTVALHRADEGRGRGWVADSVTYAGHAWRYAFDWLVLDDVGSIADGTHPVVYVARGSHASYPLGCRTHVTGVPGTCRQLGRNLPDGMRRNVREWRFNASCDACLLPLPTDQFGAPAGWNAFGGRWGAAACTVGLKLCVRGDGPPSPSYQRGRYDCPEGAPPGDVGDLYRRAGKRFRLPARAESAAAAPARPRCGP